MAEDSESQRFFNFLQHYDLQRYHQKFLDMGVRKISHLKDVDDDDLELVGLSRPERSRLRKKLEKNFSLTGKLMNSVLGKSNKFNVPLGDEKEKDSGQVQPQKEQQQQQQQHPSPTIINSKQIKLGRQIGQGAFGAVHEATWSNVHGSVVVAVKFLLSTKQSDEAYQTFHKEVASMCALNHPHIVKLYGIMLDSPVALVEELAPLGNLHSRLIEYGSAVKLQLLHTYACQIADAMQYLEAHRVIHRDLATRNILLVEEDFVKLSDFGMARVLNEHSSIYNLSNLNTRIPIAWSSLEALQRAKFSTASDVWSYGVTLWEIYSLGAVPWEGLAPVEVRDKLAVGERLGRPALCPSDVYRLMEACWNAVPSKRPTFQYIYQAIQELSPKKVLAIRSHLVDGEDILNFKVGEIIYIIDRPKPGWMYGIKSTGERGHFQEDYITTELDPLGKLKEKVQTGSAKVKDLSISGPIHVAHEYHWGSDGSRWVSEEAPDGVGVALSDGSGTSDLRGINSPTPPTNSASPSSTMGDRYSVAITAEPQADPSHQHHSSGEVTPSTSTQSPPQGHTSADRFSPPAGYAVPPHTHSSGGDECSCNTSDQRSSRGSLLQGSGTLSSEDHGNGTPLDEEYMVLMSPRSKSMQDESVMAGYQAMQPSPANVKRPTPVEYGSFGPRRPDQSKAEIQLVEVEAEEVARGSAAVSSSSKPAVGPSDRMVCLPPGIPANVGPALGRERQSLPRPPVPHKPAVHRQLNVSTSSPPGLLDSLVAMTATGPLHQPLIQPPRSPPSVKTVPALPPRSPSRSASSVDQSKSQAPVPLPRRNISVTSMEQSLPSPGPSTKPSYAVNTSHRDMPLVDVLLLEFPGVSASTCKRILETHKYSLTEAKEYLQVEQLMSMGISNVTEQDCRRALEHCQYSVDRAAGWLLDRN